MLTCYDFWTANIVENSSIDSLLVGDSLSMVMHGHDSTVTATMDMMELHTQAIARGAPSKFIVGDMPFLSSRGSLDKSVDKVIRLMRVGAQAVKIEGVRGNEALTNRLVESGVPVMGHLGLMPQSVNTLGGYKVQGKNRSKLMRLPSRHYWRRSWVVSRWCSSACQKRWVSRLARLWKYQS